jgi:hypothetical protein
MRKKITYLFVACLLCTFTFLTGQTVVWPTDSLSRRAAQFNGGLNGWITSGGIVDDNGNFFKDTKTKWIWSTGKRLVKSPTATPTDSSTALTAGNGVVVFDAEYVADSLRVDGNLFGEITSPSIDVDGKNNLTLLFSSYFYKLNADVYYTWSEDGGTTWKDTSVVSHYRKFALSGINHSDFPLEAGWKSFRDDQIKIKLLNSKGTKNFKIKFFFIGTEYYWIIDDIALVTYDNDLQINRDFFAVAPNYAMPKNQVEPLRFLSDVSNQGNKTQTNVKLNVKVRNASTNVELYSDTLNYGSLKPDSLAQNVPFTKTFSVPTQSRAAYRATYRIFGDSSDQYRFNDTAAGIFFANDSVFQKDIFGGIISRGLNNALWPTNQPKNYRFGNYFFVPNGKSSTATSIITSIANTEALVGKKISAYLLKWKQPLIDSSVVREKDIEVIADGELTIPITATSDDFLRIPLQSSLSTSNKNAYLEDNTAYLAVVEYLPSNTSEEEVSPWYDNTIDFGAMELATSLAGKPRRTTVMGGFSFRRGFRGNIVSAQPQDYLINVFGTQDVPVVRLTVLPFRVNTNDILSDANKMDVYPNPVQNVVTVEFDLEKSTDVMVRIVNINGQTVLDKQYGITKKERSELNVSHLPSGTYMMQILTADGIKTKQFSIAK